MKFYLAPMEGITGFVYRNAYHKYFEPFDKYFMPFISPNPKGKLAPWEIADILPEHNIGMYAVPQILTNRADEFISTAKQLKEYGYDEVNLNLGCPSKNVVAKWRGSGFLEKTEELDRFLEKIFTHLSMKISVKTRIGRWDADEFEELLEIYNKYPLQELIIHPRVQKDYYGNIPNFQVFHMAYRESKSSVCYNGDIFTEEDYSNIIENFKELDAVMMGRGVLKTPYLLSEIKGNAKKDLELFQAFHDELLEGYLQTIHGERNAICKMKEVWGYFRHSFHESDEALKSIRMTDDRASYQKAVMDFWQQAYLR